jgi:molybdopterin-containing oxidoreductase family iron-sulfur binding subunit
LLLYDEAWARMMEGAGWWAPGYSSAEELWKKAVETGGWWDPFYDHADWKRVLQTDSGRFELHPELLAADPRRRAGVIETDTARAGDDPSAQKLALLLFEPLAISGGTGAELPFLQRILDPGHEEAWETWVELHPETAARLRVKDRSMVRVPSGQGVITARARVTPRVVAGAAAMPVGLGKRGGGRWAAGVGSNPLRLLGVARDPLSGAADPAATPVQIASDGEAVQAPPAKRRA